jgi:rhodanese-related sulfurtransferase
MVLIEMGEYVFRHKIRSACMQAVSLIVLAVVLALAVNTLRPEGLVLPGNWNPSVAAGMQTSGFGLVTLDEAWSLYTREKSFFLDAREPFAYEQGHLPGAINIPVSRVEEHLEQLQTFIGGDRVFVTYCDSLDCPLSYELAGLLKAQGIAPVSILKQGWIGWYEAGFPYEEGPAE